MSWENGKAVALDLYYDPVVDEHVAHGAVGIIAPTWYFAPQKHEVALAGWQTAAMVHDVFGDGPVTGLADPARATTLLQMSGEFADRETKDRIWTAAEHYIEPTWDRERGEFTLGFGFNEAHPRGQMNARAMAGWVCTPGAWARIFNAPNLDKFDQPTVHGVDFPAFALSQAYWDGDALHLAVQPQNATAKRRTTSLKITNIASTAGWVLTQANGDQVNLSASGKDLEVQMVADNQAVTIRQN